MIVILSDHGRDELFMEIVRAKLMSLAPDQKVMKIFETIDLGDLYTASSVLERFAFYMEKNTIFLACVSSFNESSYVPIAMITKDGKIFVGFDNGVFTSAIERFGIRQIRRIDMPSGFSPSFMHSTLDVLVPTTAKLAAGMDFKEVGDLYMTYYNLKHKRARVDGNTIKGDVSFVNGLGCIETNIPHEFLTRIGLEMGDRVKLNGKKAFIAFDERDGQVGELMIREGIGEYIEVFSRGVRAADLLKVRAKSEIRLEV